MRRRDFVLAVLGALILVCGASAQSPESWPFSTPGAVVDRTISDF